MDSERTEATARGPHGHRTASDEGTPNTYTHHLGVALNRALERRLGRMPSPTRVNIAVDTLKASPFVQHAIRVQKQLASLHAQLQRTQEKQVHMTDAVEDTSVSFTRLPKRPAGHNGDVSESIPPREAKRARIESTGSQPPSTEAKPDTQAPDASMSRQGALNAQKNMRSSDSTTAELLDADPATPQAVVDDLPARLVIMDTNQQSNTNNTTTTSEPSRETIQHPPSNGHLKSQVAHNGVPAPVDTSSDGTHVQDKLRLGQVPSPSISTSTPEAQGVPLATVASPSTAMGFPAYTLQPVLSSTPSSAPPNPFVAKVPGIWAIQVGKPSVGQTDVAFEVDQDTVNAVHRWATHRRGFDPNARHVVVHLVALRASAVSAAQQSLSQSPGGITPEAFALAVRDLQPQWPDDGSLVLQLNAGQPEEQAWFPSDMSGETRLDVSGAVRVGTNSLGIMQLRGMADAIFVVYAFPPTPEALSAALEWEKSRRLYSFVRPPSE